MPVDAPKHPSMYPIWMRQAIEAALADIGVPVFAVEVNDDAQERRLRRAFRAYVKAVRRQIIPQWTAEAHEAFQSCWYKLTHQENELQSWLELTATAGYSAFAAERLEVWEQLRGLSEPG